jgi:Mn-dependent DtxR family transcriptional regulator
MSNLTPNIRLDTVLGLQIGTSWNRAEKLRDQGLAKLETARGIWLVDAGDAEGLSAG